MVISYSIICSDKTSSKGSFSLRHHGTLYFYVLGLSLTVLSPAAAWYFIVIVCCFFWGGGGRKKKKRDSKSNTTE
jgi:hypothetical protein